MMKKDKVFKIGPLEKIDPVAYGVGEVISTNGNHVTVKWEHSGREYIYKRSELLSLKDQIQWVYCGHRLPQSCSLTNYNNPYYFIELDDGTKVTAMFIENEWWESYEEKIGVPVRRWIDNV